MTVDVQIETAMLQKIVDDCNAQIEAEKMIEDFVTDRVREFHLLGYGKTELMKACCQMYYGFDFEKNDMLELKRMLADVSDAFYEEFRLYDEIENRRFYKKFADTCLKMDFKAI